MSCPHNDYDDYFERCGDCGKDAETIHATECGPDAQLDDDNCCTRCGYEVAA